MYLDDRANKVFLQFLHNLQINQSVLLCHWTKRRLINNAVDARLTGSGRNKLGQAAIFCRINIERKISARCIFCTFSFFDNLTLLCIIETYCNYKLNNSFFCI